MKYFLGGIGMLVLWAALAFGVRAQTGWIHIPLGIGVALIAAGIVLTDDRSTADADRGP